MMLQVAMMEGTYLAVEFMSRARGGRGGVVINVSSMGGGLHTRHYLCCNATVPLTLLC